MLPRLKMCAKILFYVRKCDLKRRKCSRKAKYVLDVLFFVVRKLVAAEVAEVLEQYKMCASRESELRVRLSTCHYYCVKFMMRLMFATRSWRLGIHDCAVRRTTKIPAKISTFLCPPPAPPALSPVIGTLASPGAEIGTAI
jgi:hypothetical protein